MRVLHEDELVSLLGLVPLFYESSPLFLYANNELNTEQGERPTEEKIFRSLFTKLVHWLGSIYGLTTSLLLRCLIPSPKRPQKDQGRVPK
jgi:hypothetical protein